jgi:hypothetical protein|tara:strand:- start:9251 stop:9475 length:225 start_codon:yes stop_codon:yes gene_type:complete
MCLPSRPSAPPPPAPDPMAMEAQRQQRAENQAVRSERKADVLEKGIRRARGGSGRRSLLSKTSKGGMGYYNEFL